MSSNKTLACPWYEPVWRLVDAYFGNESSGLSWPNAILCSGAQGLEKKSFVDLLVKKLFCSLNQQNKLPGFKLPELLDASGEKEYSAPGATLKMPCGSCQGCRLLAAGNHSDYLEVGLTENATQIKIEQIRQVIALVNLSPQIATLKIILIHPVEKLNENASNALLKSLEEPPGDTLYILMTHQLNSVKATIRSRCRLVDFKAPGHDEIKQWLTSEGLDVLPVNKDIDLLASFYGNAPALIKQALEQGMLDKLKSWSIQLRKLHQLNPIDLLRLYKEWSPEGVDQLLRWTQFWLMGILKNKLSSTNHSRQHAELKRLFALLDLVLSKQRLLADSPQLNEQLLFLDLAYQWMGSSVREV